MSQGGTCTPALQWFLYFLEDFSNSLFTPSFEFYVISHSFNFQVSFLLIILFFNIVILKMYIEISQECAFGPGQSLTT